MQHRDRREGQGFNIMELVPPDTPEWFDSVTELSLDFSCSRPSPNRLRRCDVTCLAGRKKLVLIENLDTAVSKGVRIELKIYELPLFVD
jgi:hypothetical protein